MHHTVKLSKTQCPNCDDEVEIMSRVSYNLVIGSIIYVMICTRPDASYTLSMVSRYQYNPGGSNWTIVKNILKYLMNTKDIFLVFGGKYELIVNRYSDSSFQTGRDDSFSQFVCLFLLNDGVITWKSSKQNTVAKSTYEAEYIAASEATKEAGERMSLAILELFDESKKPWKSFLIMKVQSP